MSDVAVQAVARDGERQCPYCKSAIASLESAWTCPSCETPHHRDCARSNGRCTVFACSGVVSIPVRVPEAPKRRLSGWLVAELALLPTIALLVFLTWLTTMNARSAGVTIVLILTAAGLVGVALVIPLIALAQRVARRTTSDGSRGPRDGSASE